VAEFGVVLLGIRDKEQALFA
jgi:hypothetical protein